MNRRRLLAGGAGLLGALAAAVFSAVQFGRFVRRADIAATKGMTPPRTPEEQQLVDDLARLHGWPLTWQEANFAIEQARAFGEL